MKNPNTYVINENGFKSLTVFEATCYTVTTVTSFFQAIISLVDNYGWKDH